jgi:D-2-hydroxyacid dehydrogenase (NADP+)
MKVIAARRSPTGDIEANGVQVYKWQDRVEVLKNSDFVVASLPGTPETKHCIDMSSFKEMKPDAVFINVGRGSTVKEVDLIEALKKKIIKGAACDVFEVEPLPNTSELYQLPNMLISPHNADNTPSYYPSTVERFVTLAKQYYLKSLPFPRLVDLDLGY